MTPQTILVTGATNGLGLALVRALKQAGHTPILTGRQTGLVAELAAEIGVPGYALDVGNHASLAETCARIEAEQGPLHGLVNNAGIWLEGDFDSYDPARIQAVLDINATGTILMTHAVLPGMIARGSGVVINTVSTGALYCRKSISVYAASKWAIRGFTGCMEVECAPKGVRVMGFYPGKIASNMYEAAGNGKALDMAMTPEQGAAMMLRMLEDDGMVWAQVSGRSIHDYV